MKILIVKLSAFGDIIHTLPALDDVLTHKHVHEVHWLVDERFAFVTDIFPAQVKVHKVALKGKSRIRHAWQMIKELRQENFDIIFDLQGLIKSGMMAWASATAGCRIYGFDQSQSPEWPNRWFVKPVTFHPSEQHVVPLYRHIIAAGLNNLNIEQAYTAPYIQITADMQQQGQQALDEINIKAPFSILHVGGSYMTKRLPDSQWQALTQQMQKQQTLLILWGNTEEKQRAEDISKQHKHIIVAPRCFSLPTLSGIMGKASAYLGQDTGVTHLAAACGCPTLTLWGATAPWRMGALGTMHKHIIPNTHCHPCFKRTCSNFICMPSLSTEEIYHAWQEVRK